MSARKTRIELALLLAEGIAACNQDLYEQLNRIAALPDRDYFLALHGYQIAGLYARRERQRQQEEAA